MLTRYAMTFLPAVIVATAVGAPRNCPELTQLTLPDIRIHKAVASQGEELEDSAPLPDVVPANHGKALVPHCKVEGTVGEEINLELLLPDDWNGKFMMGGGGGFVGSMQNQARDSVNRGYATVGTDTGHKGEGLEAEWAHNHLERQVNFGYLAVHRTAEAAKAIIRAYYESPAKYSYFSGCSNGGRQGLMEAQRFPEDFDGIIAGAPVHDLSGFGAAILKRTRLIFPDPLESDSAVITPDNLRLLESAVLDECDRLDGVEDGILNDPRDCDFQLSSLPQCASDRPAAHCLTGVQREAIAAVYGGARDQEGQLYPGVPLGGESDWHRTITGSDALPFTEQLFKFLILRDTKFDYTSYDLESFRSDRKLFSSFADATDPDLSEFKKAGGKLIVWYGWADSGLTALSAIDYFEAVAARDTEVLDYLRTFVLPGVFHCSEGPGPDRVDWIDAIEDWVERGKAPERLTAYRVTEGNLDMTRPLCVFPQRAVYKGSGSTDDAANFECRDPE